MSEADPLAGVAPETLIEMQRRMWLIRKFEEAAARLVDSGELEGEVHLSIGQEGEIVGSCLALRADDYMTGNHRSHGHPIGKGADPAGLMAELMGKATGVCKGKGGSMHLADFSVGSLGESGIVASAIPVAVGAAMSAQIQGNGKVVLSFFGDGAVNEGAFHESMNLASVGRRAELRRGEDVPLRRARLPPAGRDHVPRPRGGAAVAAAGSDPSPPPAPPRRRPR